MINAASDKPISDCAKAKAVARPIPVLLPVTHATCPSNENIDRPPLMNNPFMLL
jgi:hypothetical protein